MATIVSGTRRSGTSMMMLCLKEAGFKITGKAMGDKGNPKGYWEIGATTSGLKVEIDGIVKVVSDAIYKSKPELIDKVIVMYRNPLKVIQSMLDIGIVSNAKGLMEKNNLDTTRTYEFIQHIPHITVYYEEMLEDPEKEMKKVCEFLGGGDYKKGAKVVDPKLNKTKEYEAPL